MIGLDTNVIVRVLLNDDEVQSARARDVLNGLREDRPGYVSVATFLELEWVLRSTGDMPRERVADALQSLLETTALRVQHMTQVALAVRAYRGGADFADALIAGLCDMAGCERIVTFDRKAARIEGMELIA